MIVTLNNKVIGTIQEQTYKKTVRKSKHLFREWNGYSISKSVLEDLRATGIEKIDIFEKESKTHLLSSVSDYFKYGHELWIKNYEPQICLNLKYFREEK